MIKGTRMAIKLIVQEGRSKTWSSGRVLLTNPSNPCQAFRIEVPAWSLILLNVPQTLEDWILSNFGPISAATWVARSGLFSSTMAAGSAWTGTSSRASSVWGGSNGGRSSSASLTSGSGRSSIGVSGNSSVFLADLGSAWRLSTWVSSKSGRLTIPPSAAQSGSMTFRDDSPSNGKITIDSRLPSILWSRRWTSALNFNRGRVLKRFSVQVFGFSGVRIRIWFGSRFIWW